jgi:hypothetical protein
LLPALTLADKISEALDKEYLFQSAPKRCSISGAWEEMPACDEGMKCPAPFLISAGEAVSLVDSHDTEQLRMEFDVQYDVCSQAELVSASKMGFCAEKWTAPTL